MAGFVAGTSSFDSLYTQIYSSKDLGYSVHFIASVCESMNVSLRDSWPGSQS